MHRRNMAMIDVSIVVPTKNACDRIGPTIDALLSAVHASTCSAEVIVVDNGSNDGTAALLARQWPDDLTILRVTEVGSSSAKNAGVRIARGGVLLFVDDDVRVPPNWLDAMSAPLRSGAADIVCGAIRLASDIDVLRLDDLHRRWLSDTLDGLGTPPSTAVGASMGATRAVFDAGAWFHPDLGPGRSGFMEDHLWYLDAVKRGFRGAFVQSAPVSHDVDRARLARAGWLARAVKQGRSEGLGRVIYGSDAIATFDVLRAARAVVRRAWRWLPDSRSSVPSARYLESVCAQHATVSFLRERLRRPSISVVSRPAA